MKIFQLNIQSILQASLRYDILNVFVEKLFSNLRILRNLELLLSLLPIFCLCSLFFSKFLKQVKQINKTNKPFLLVLFVFKNKLKFVFKNKLKIYKNKLKVKIKIKLQQFDIFTCFLFVSCNTQTLFLHFLSLLLFSHSTFSVHFSISFLSILSLPQFSLYIRTSFPLPTFSLFFLFSFFYSSFTSLSLHISSVYFLTLPSHYEFSNFLFPFSHSTFSLYFLSPLSLTTLSFNFVTYCFSPVFQSTSLPSFSTSSPFSHSTFSHPNFSLHFVLILTLLSVPIS